MQGRRLKALYICYLSLDDPLTRTQVVAYLEGLAAAGHQIHLLTFEPERLAGPRRRVIRAELAARGITWHGLRYHKRPSLPATIFDVAVGAVVGAWLLARFNLDTIHARSHVPAAMALVSRWLTAWRPTALIFDIRGLMAEEYEDAGRWKPGGIPSRLTNGVERKAIDAAAGIVVLTHRIRERLFNETPDPRVVVIPCCADTESLVRSEEWRASCRTALGLSDQLVMIYVGKFGGWYMAQEMAAFFAAARAEQSDLHFLILTQSAADTIREALRAHGVTTGFTLTTSAPGEVGRYLAAADFGISFIRPSISKESSSPTKVGEYLAAGKPVLATAGVGDLDALISPEVGVLVSDHESEAYRRAFAQIRTLLLKPETSRRCRALAERELSLSRVGIPRYLDLYSRVASSTAMRGSYPHERAKVRREAGRSPRS